MSANQEFDSRDIISKGSKSFAAAARLFSEDIREDVYLLYAWCRHCDDEIDGQHLGFGHEAMTSAEQQRRLAEITERTQRAIDGQPTTDPVFAGLQRVVQRYGIPARYPLELIEGFAMDVEHRRYIDLEDTLLYCYHVAGVVGVMMAYIMGVNDERVLRRAADLGIAFQITNISRDIMDDAENGRVYVPESWLEEAGVPADEVSLPQHREAVAHCVKRLLAVADRYYSSARQGLGELPLRCAWAVAAADRVYHNIGDIVNERGEHAWDERVVAPAYRKIYWVMRSGFTALRVVKLEKRRVMADRAEDLWAKPDPC